MHELKDTEKRDQAIIECKGVSYSYGLGDVLKDVSFSIEKGQYVGIIGPNGGGKTTLLRLLLGLVPASSGEVRLFGTHIHEFKKWHRLGYVSQKAADFDPLFPATVEEVVRMGRFVRRGLFKPLLPEDYQKTKEALKNVNMLEFKDRRVGDLSGGQKQRVLIARALASEPEVIMLDEPTTGLDQESESQFFKLLKDLNVRLGLTLVLVSHDLERVAEEVTQVAVVHKTLDYYKNPEEAIVHKGSVAAHIH